MRLRRITLRNFMGVDERTVDIGDGVTIVAGPNEVGKSTLARALDLLLTYKDSSKHRAVVAAKPVHLDVGPEVEVDLEAGDYRLTYRKRFVKKSETVLTVTAPTQESHTGDEAHERAHAILAESTDLALWRALRIDQGVALGLPQLEDNASLTMALDAAAGTANTDDTALTLYDRVAAEYERWFTATGREKKDLTDLQAAVEQHEAERAEVEAQLQALERDADRSRAIAAEIRGHKERLAIDEQDQQAADKAWRALERRLTELERIEAESTAATARSEAALAEQGARDALIADVAERTTTLESAQADAAQGDPSATAAAEQLSTAADALEAALAADTAAERVRALRESDLEHRQTLEQHARLSERFARILAAEEASESAERTLASSRVDVEQIEAVRDAARAAREARIRADAGSAQVRIEAAAAVSVEHDGEQEELSAGDDAEHAALGDVVIEAPGVVRVTVRPAGDAAELREAITLADEHLAHVLRHCGLDSPEAAEEAHAAHVDAERAVSRREELVTQNLGELTREALERSVTTLAARIETYPTERVPVPGAEKLPPTTEAAQEALGEARTERTTAAEALTTARRRHDEARDRSAASQLGVQDARTRVEVAGRDVERAKTALEAARTSESDADLRARSASLATEAEAARDRATEARRAIAAARPEAVELAAKGAAAAVAATRQGLRDAEDEALQLRTRLRGAGQSGLAERLDGILTGLHHADRTHRSTRRLANAAKLLFETLSAKRDEARTRYVAPLREQIVRLGRLVFGATFDIELDEDLTITHRTLDGRTVPFAGLSGGAQEQLDILMRAAAAMLVSDAGGVPLILDDALGYSDPERQRALGAVLALAGEQCQVILLTCVADRYRHVPGATVLRLP